MHPTLLTLSALSAKSPEENPDSSDPQTGPVRQTTQPPLLISWSNQLLVEPPLSTFDVPPRDLLNTPNSSPGMLSRKKEHEHPDRITPSGPVCCCFPLLAAFATMLASQRRYGRALRPPHSPTRARGLGGCECHQRCRMHGFDSSNSLVPTEFFVLLKALSRCVLRLE